MKHLKPGIYIGIVTDVAFKKKRGRYMSVKFEIKHTMPNLQGESFGMWFPAVKKRKGGKLYDGSRV